MVAPIPGRAATASSSINQTYGLPAHLNADLTATQCDNHGSTIDFSGTLTLGGVGVTIVFENNTTTGPGNHKVTVTGTADFEITPADGTFPIPKQPSQGGVGGNPWFSFGVKDANGTWIIPPIILGRCVQGFSAHYSQDFGLPASAAALLGALDCNNQGPNVTLGASNSTDGINGTLLLDNNKNKAVHEKEAAANLQVTLAPPMVVAKQGNVGGPGGNPIILAGFTGTGNPTLTNLGRCNKLG
jgi:hypothetical protein